MFDEGLVSSLFRRRKSEKSVEGNVCPYCEFVNEENVETCAQCYYSMNLPARNQPMATPTTSGSELMNTLMEENELEKEEFAVEAVLSLDEVAVEVDQYDISNDKEDSFQFIRGSTPELSQTVNLSNSKKLNCKRLMLPKTLLFLTWVTRIRLMRFKSQCILVWAICTRLLLSQKRMMI